MRGPSPKAQDPAPEPAAGRKRPAAAQGCARASAKRGTAVRPGQSPEGLLVDLSRWS